MRRRVDYRRPRRLTVLELRGVSKRFGDTVALRPTDLEVSAAHTAVLIGPSGCGKSTLLRLVNGLLRPDAGEVRVDGEPLTGDNVLEVRRRIGYVIQDGGLFPHLDAAANAGLMARYLGWDRRRISRRLRELAELTHLPADALRRFPAQLSGGQAQRVALIRALMLDPDLLLLDEPLGALDPMIRAELQDDLRQIFRELDKTVVLVTHDLAEAAHFGHDVVLMRSGSIVQRGTIGDLRRRPAEEFVTTFVEAQRSLHRTEVDDP